MDGTRILYPPQDRLPPFSGFPRGVAPRCHCDAFLSVDFLLAARRLGLSRRPRRFGTSGLSRSSSTSRKSAMVDGDFP